MACFDFHLASCSLIASFSYSHSSSRGTLHRRIRIEYENSFIEYENTPHPKKTASRMPIELISATREQALQPIELTGNRMMLEIDRTVRFHRYRRTMSRHGYRPNPISLRERSILPSFQQFGQWNRRFHTPSVFRNSRRCIPNRVPTIQVTKAIAQVTALINLNLEPSRVVSINVESQANRIGVRQIDIMQSRSGFLLITTFRHPRTLIIPPRAIREQIQEFSIMGYLDLGWLLHPCKTCRKQINLLRILPYDLVRSAIQERPIRHKRYLWLPMSYWIHGWPHHATESAQTA